ncbi:MAG: NAD-dependent epimerase/dehydratase family protein [Kiritimatiellae bacterium]|nr:NAD-dependent epimerase/dehydratase family protein [Kiritimatiellia bacterium]
MIKNQNIVVTGGAGFIGSHLCEALLREKTNTVICLDNFNDFYDPVIKRNNISSFQKHDQFNLYSLDILHKEDLEQIFEKENIHTIFHLAARAGVRPSIQSPKLYAQVNIEGTINLLECAKEYNVEKFILASTSSIYGNKKKVPFSETDPVDHPVSPYATTKKAAELMCYNYHHLYQIPMACIRFFTVYGPRQRPEMAIHMFTKHILEGTPIPVFNHGKCERDYTYIDDIIQGVLKVSEFDFSFDIVNLGESKTITTLDLIKRIEKACGKKAKLELIKAQPGDVEKTYADITRAKKVYGYDPQYPIEKGLHMFVEWYKHL